MRAYLIVPPGTELYVSGADALVLDGCSPSLRAEGEAIQGHPRDGGEAALDGFAALAMTEAQTSASSCKLLLLVRVAGIEALDLDACLERTVGLRPDAILLPARHGRDVAHLGARLAVLEAEHGLSDGGIGIVALIACAAGVLAADTFVGASDRLCGLGWDAVALAGQLGMPLGPDRTASRPYPHPGGEGPILAHARAVVRFAAAAAGVEAIEAAYLGDDGEGFRAHVAAARRDGFGAVMARNPGQVRLIRAEA